MNLDELKKEAFKANIMIVENSLVVLTWGNASAFDKESGIFAIKPSGVPYHTLKWEDMVLVNLDGEVVDSKLRPSSDTQTHLEIYKGFDNVGGVVHTHSKWATIWAQSGISIPALGTTHADHFHGSVPCISVLTKDQVDANYEMETGRQIVNTFNELNINPIEMPACLLANHAPFTWGKTVNDAVNNSIALEQCAEMAYFTLSLNKNAELPGYIMEKHYSRKHGLGAYYGQK